MEKSSFFKKMIASPGSRAWLVAGTMAFTAFAFFFLRN
jgi:hypothetical protein